LPLAQGREGARRPVTAAPGGAVLRVEVGELGPGADGARPVAPRVLAPAELPEVGGAGGVGRGELAQPAQGLERRVEQLGIGGMDLAGVEGAQGADREVAVGAQGGHPLQVLAGELPEGAALGPVVVGAAAAGAGEVGGRQTALPREPRLLSWLGGGPVEGGEEAGGPLPLVAPGPGNGLPQGPLQVTGAPTDGRP